MVYLSTDDLVDQGGCVENRRRFFHGRGIRAERTGHGMLGRGIHGRDPAIVEADTALVATGAPTPQRRSRPSLWRPAITLVALLALVALGSRHGGSSPAPGGTGLAALVNGVPVSMAAYEWQLQVATRAYAGPKAPPASPTGKTIARLLRDQAVQEAIAETLIDHEAALHHVTVSDAAVGREVAHLTSEAGGVAGLTHQLQIAGMSMNDLRRVARHMLLRDRLAVVLDDPAWLDHMVGRAQITYYVGDGAAGPDNVPAIELGHPAPPFVAVDLAGRAVSLADLHGRAVVLEFWSSACYACQSELPLLRDFARTHPRITVVALNRQESAQTARQFIRALGLGGLAVWLDGSGQAALNYTVTGLPATFFIDAHGILRGYNFGPLADEQSLAVQAGYAVRGITDMQTG